MTAASDTPVTLTFTVSSAFAGAVGLATPPEHIY